MLIYVKMRGSCRYLIVSAVTGAVVGDDVFCDWSLAVAEWRRLSAVLPSVPFVIRRVAVPVSLVRPSSPVGSVGRLPLRERFWCSRRRLLAVVRRLRLLVDDYFS